MQTIVLTNELATTDYMFCENGLEEQVFIGRIITGGL